MAALRFLFTAACWTVAAAAPALAESHVTTLSEADARHYQAAFAAIDAHNWAGARAQLGQVDDNVLVGVARGRMLADRSYRASYGELTSWLNTYGALGVAPVVYDRAEAARPHRGRGRRRHPVGAPPPYPEQPAIRIPAGASRTPPGDSASARADIAAIADRLASGDFDAARAIGDRALQGPRAGDAHWWLGLVAYRTRDYSGAVQHFDAAAAWPYFSTWTSSAAHYWAARARLAAGTVAGVSLHLEAATRNPYTFYGQLSEAQLGRDSGLTFERPVVSDADLQTFLNRRPAARRAAALAQVGRLNDAELELKRLHGDLSSAEDANYLALAGALDAPSAQLRASEFGGPELSAGFCPTNSFTPADGFTLDRALVFAIVRQESHFNPNAVSPSNARGLMQLLPSTARDMDRSHNYRRAPTPLFDPALNMQLGQQYVRWLMDMFHQDGDLGRVFAAYNGGPGWLQRWLATQADTSDPLMILETLPRSESRDYAERVLAHMGVCRARYQQERVEIDRLAAGRPAHYEPMDNRVSQVASAVREAEQR